MSPNAPAGRLVGGAQYAASEEQLSPVIKALDALREQIDELDVKLTALSDRLSLVPGPDRQKLSNQTAPVPPKESHSPLTDILNERAEVIKAINNTLTDLFNRLEI